MAGDRWVSALIRRRRRRRRLRREPNQQPLASRRPFPTPNHSPRRRPHLFLVSRRSLRHPAHPHLRHPPRRVFLCLMATRAWGSDGTSESLDPNRQQQERLRQTWKPPRPSGRIELPFEFPALVPRASLSSYLRFAMRDAWFVSQGDRRPATAQAASKCWHPFCVCSHLRSPA